MTPCLAALVAGLLVGGIVGAWLGATGRIWALLIRELVQGRKP
jgi:hypothetical protein